MLRSLISAFAILLVAGALVLTIMLPFEWPLLAGALLLAFGCLAERSYHGVQTAPEGRLRRTGERFVDPETGRPVTVWSDPVTGERRYVEDEA
jgi:hypothetical protein